jgi:hypothetical protein
MALCFREYPVVRFRPYVNLESSFELGPEVALRARVAVGRGRGPWPPAAVGDPEHACVGPRGLSPALRARVCFHVRGIEWA